MTHLVDSDYVADYLKGQRNATTFLERLLPEGLAISIITFAEVYEGVFNTTNRAHAHVVWCVKEPGSGVGRRV